MRAPGYRLHKQSGQARVTIRGKDHLLGPYNSRESREKYNKLLAKHLAEKASTEVKKIRLEDTEFDGSLGACVTKFLDHALIYYATGNEYKHFNKAIAFLQPLFDQMASEFGPKLYKEVRESMIGPTRSRQYVNKLMGRIRQFVKWCVAEELMEPGIYQAIKCVPSLKAGRTELEESKDIQPVDPKLVDLTIAKMPQVLADMVRVQLLLGCRPGEVCKITPGMIDRSEAVWQIHLNKHKTAWRGKKRIIYAGPQAQAILVKYLERDAGKTLFSPQEAMEQRRVAKAQERITPRNQGNSRGYGKRTRQGWGNYRCGEVYTTESYAKAIRYACEAAKVELWSPNQLRHTAGTIIRKQFGIEAAQVILGHSELSVTQIYAEADREKAIEIAGRVG